MMFCIISIYICSTTVHGQGHSDNKDADDLNESQLYDFAPDYIIDSVYNSYRGRINSDELSLRRDIEQNNVSDEADNIIDTVKPKGPRAGAEAGIEEEETTEEEYILEVADEDQGQVPQDILNYIKERGIALISYRITNGNDGWNLVWVEEMDDGTNEIYMRSFDVNGMEVGKEVHIASSDILMDIGYVNIFKDGNIAVFWKVMDSSVFETAYSYAYKIFDRHGNVVSGGGKLKNYYARWGFLVERFHKFTNGNLGVFWYKAVEKSGQVLLSLNVFDSKGKFIQKQSYPVIEESSIFIEDIKTLPNGDTLFMWKEYIYGKRDAFFFQIFDKDGRARNKPTLLADNKAITENNGWRERSKFVVMPGGKIVFITPYISDKQYIGSAERDFLMVVSDPSGKMINRTIIHSDGIRERTMLLSSTILIDREENLVILWHQYKRDVQRILLHKVDMHGSTIFKKNITYREGELQATIMLLHTAVLSNGNICVQYNQMDSMIIDGRKMMVLDLGYYFKFYDSNGELVRSHYYGNKSFTYKIISKNRIAVTALINNNHYVSLFSLNGEKISKDYEAFRYLGIGYSGHGIYEINERYLVMLWITNGHMGIKSKIYVSLIDLEVADNNPDKARCVEIDSVDALSITFDRIQILKNGSIDIVALYKDNLNVRSHTKNIKRHNIKVSRGQLDVQTRHTGEREYERTILTNRFLRSINERPWWWWRSLESRHIIDRVDDVGSHTDRSNSNSKGNAIKAINDDHIGMAGNVYQAADMNILGSSERNALWDQGYTGLDNLKDMSWNEADISSLIDALKNKENRTDIEDTILALSESIMEESSMLDDTALMEFEETIDMVIMLETMNQMGHAVQLNFIRETLHNLLYEHNQIYKVYLTDTENIYLSVAQLLGISIEAKYIADSSTPLARFNKILAGRKHAVDKQLDILQAKDADRLTENEKQALEIAENELMPVRMKYIKVLESIVTKYMREIRKKLESVNPFIISETEKDLNALIQVNRSITNRE